jgi:hypothetical protein
MDDRWVTDADGNRHPHPQGRESSGRFAPGYSGNPRGRPPGHVSFRTYLRRIFMGDPNLMEEIIRTLIRDGQIDSKMALQLMQWHDGDNPDAFDKEQQLATAQATRNPADVLMACVAALRQAGLDDVADRLQEPLPSGQQED